MPAGEQTVMSILQYGCLVLLLIPKKAMYVLMRIYGISILCHVKPINYDKKSTSLLSLMYPVTRYVCLITLF